MAISFDAASSLNSGAWVSGSTLSWNHTCAADASVLIMGIFPGGFSDAMTAVTYGGQAMTRVLIWSYNGSTINTEYVMLYYLASPPTGTNSISVTFSGSQPNAAGGAVSYKGTATSSAVIDSFAGTSNSSTNIHPSTTVIKSNCWIVGISRMSAGTYSGISGGINRGGYNNGGVTFFDTNGTVGTGAQAPVTVNNSGSGNNVAVIASIALPPLGPANVKTWDGVTQSTGIKTYGGLAVGSTKSVIGVT